MITTPLQLTALQQTWLRELQVATPFLARSYKVLAEPSSVAIEPPSLPNSEVAPALKPQQARATLHSQLGLKKEEPVLESVARSPVADLPPIDQLNLSQLHHYAEQCAACDLHVQRQRAVFGAGEETNPDWMVISIAPSSNEEMAGLPMQGKSGELFDNQLQSIAIPATTTFYRTQLLKCRSPQHANAHYIQACQRILWRQIELIGPRHLLLLGEETAMVFFGQNTPFESLRGQVQTWTNPWGAAIPAIVTYDPVALLLRPQDKVNAWADLLLMQTLIKH